MPNTSNTDLPQMLYLKDYASLIKEKKLEDFVSAYLMNLYAFNVPLLQFFSHLKKEDLVITARQGILRLLTGIENDSAIEEVKKTLDNWKQNNLPGIPREAISLKDITLIYAAQKISFQSLLPYYTSDVSVATQVIQEIELYYKQVQEMALQMLESIRDEEQEQRIETEEKYRDLFDSASDLIQIVAPDGKILYVNHSWRTSVGYAPSELEGRYIYDFIKESEKIYFKSYREKILNGETVSSRIRTSYVKKNGEEIVLEGSIDCKYKNGRPQYTRSVFRDITQRLQQEERMKYYIEQLAEREGNLRDIIENAPDGVIVIDKDNNILLWNPKCEQIFGWKKEEVTGQKMTGIIVPVALRDAHVAGMKRFLNTREPHILNKTIEVPALHKSGAEFYISLTVSHSIQVGNDVFIAFLRDITEQKKNQQELENKRKQLEKSYQQLEQYTWLTSHDLKEPLRKILTFSDALLKNREKIDEKTNTLLEKIHSSASRMSRLIEAVLLYSNVASDHSLFVQTDLNKIVHEVLEDLEIMIGSRNAKVYFIDLPVIDAIPVQMRQLFQNLISNAVKYSSADQIPEIHIECESTQNGYIISVSDNGIGFEKIYAEKVFQVFQRLLSNKMYEGTGIGLALCKKITEAHNGTIYAESEPGKGSTFIIYLPSKHVEISSPVT
ncbi:MAG: sensor histidine kinase [Segetibacter sp.]|nr:sensor histidine kinase [Segetibacter sp.]